MFLRDTRRRRKRRLHLGRETAGFRWTCTVARGVTTYKHTPAKFLMPIRFDVALHDHTSQAKLITAKPPQGRIADAATCFRMAGRRASWGWI